MTELRYTRIGGWLILFVFANGFGGLMNSLKFFTEFNAVVAVKPQSILSLYVAADALLMIAVGIAQLVAAYQVYKLIPTAATTAKRLLFFITVGSAVSATICLVLAFNNAIPSSAALSQFVINRIMTAITTAIWLLYFKVSKRVRLTFPTVQTFQS